MSTASGSITKMRAKLQYLHSTLHGDISLKTVTLTSPVLMTYIFTLSLHKWNLYHHMLPSCTRLRNYLLTGRTKF